MFCRTISTMYLTVAGLSSPHSFGQVCGNQYQP